MSNCKLCADKKLLLVLDSKEESILLLRSNNVNLIEMIRSKYAEDEESLSINNVFNYAQEIIDETEEFIYGVIMKTNNLTSVLNLQFKEDYPPKLEMIIDSEKVISQIYEIHSHTFFQGFIKHIKYLNNQIKLI